MRKKIIIAVIILLVILLGVFIYLNVGIETEYTPETEIDEQECRNTVVSLYFQNKQTKDNSKELEKEKKYLDKKDKKKKKKVSKKKGKKKNG